MGYNNVTKSWATQKMFDDGNTWTSVVPACLTPGEYLVRHEIIALSDGYKPGGCQFYVRIPVFFMVIIRLRIILISCSLAVPRSLLSAKAPLILQDMHFQVRILRIFTLFT